MRPSSSDYARPLSPARLRTLIYNPQIKPHWLGSSDRFWFREESPSGWKYVVVNAETGEKQAAFDHESLADALTTELGNSVHAHALPIRDEHFDGQTFCFHAVGCNWTFEVDRCVLDKAAPLRSEAPEVTSPDGRWSIVHQGFDLALRDNAAGSVRSLTSDGLQYLSYGKSPESNLTSVTLVRHGVKLPPCVLWSPDSSRIFTYRLDESAVEYLALVQHVPENGSARPLLHRVKVPLTGDSGIALARPMVIDVHSGHIVWADCLPMPTLTMSMIERQQAWWTEDSRCVHFISWDRRASSATLNALDVSGGHTRPVLNETAPSYLDLNHTNSGVPNVRILSASGKFIWFSQRDGWGHLYLYDLESGTLENQITSGSWLVRDIIAVDEPARRIIFSASGVNPADDPYNRSVCTISFDGSAFSVITPEPGDHDVRIARLSPPRDFMHGDRGQPSRGLSPSGRYLVETCAKLDGLPVSSLRRASDGRIIDVIATAQIDATLASDWVWPRPFCVTAADDRTKLYGAMWLPRDFDATQKYPVIDWIYPGPQRSQVPKTALADSISELGTSAMAQLFAELGCVVMMVDGRGTAFRSKAFQDYSFGHMDNPGCLEDHVKTLHDLAAQHAFIDLDRVGIMGHSGGAHATVRAMSAYPDLFKAGVAIAGNYDQRGYTVAFCEKYQGPYRASAPDVSNFDAVADTRLDLVQRINGPLLLAHGDMDDNVHPAHTLQLVRALVDCDKGYELVIIPNEDHNSIATHPYLVKRWMDFICRHLIGR